MSTIRRVLSAYWATISLVALIVVLNVATGALWNGAGEGTDIYAEVAYGLPALQDGRWWTFFTGQFFTQTPVLYVPILVLLIVAASIYERRVGHVRTLVVAVGGQFAAAIVTALFLWLFVDSSWDWARNLGTELDLGISAGGFALLGALTAAMQPIWRRRVRVGVAAYLLGMVFNSGLLWDVEHFLGFTLGVLAGPALIPRSLAPLQLRMERRTQRALVALIVAVVAVTSIVEGLFPGNGGPLHVGGETTQGAGVTFALVVKAIVLLVLADGLRRGRRLAWIVTTGLMIAALVWLLGDSPSAERSADLVLVIIQLVLLVVTFRAFSARAARRSFSGSLRRLGWVVAALAVYTIVGFAVLADEFDPPATWDDMVTEFLARLVFLTTGNIEPVTNVARWFIGSIGVLWIVALVVTGVGLIYSSRRPPEHDDDTDELRSLLRQHESSSIEWMLTWRGIRLWFTDDRTTAIGFKVVGSVALCLGDPVGPDEQRLDALRDFDRYCFDNGWIPCLFAAGERTASMAPELGWKSVEVAEDSVMPLDDVEFKGKAWQKVRTALNRAGKQHVELVTTTWDESTPVVTDQLRAISGEWVGDKALPEMGFTLGTLREADDPEVRLHLAVDEDRTIEGFTSWLPVSEEGEVVGWTLDLMRRRDHGFPPVMDFLIGASARQFHDEGFRFMSLSAAPLAKAPDSLAGSSDQRVLQQILNLLSTTLEPYYGFQSLFHYKEKFHPEHHPMFLVFPDETALLEIGIAVARAYVPDAGLTDWIKMGWEMVGPGDDD
ncbi:MAG: phosphatidylglycerol lysyltransferase domain-containing protein [Actinomycetota bacterium]